MKLALTFYWLSITYFKITVIVCEQNLLALGDQYFPMSTITVLLNIKKNIGNPLHFFANYFHNVILEKA